jgi:hypothetical protein
VIDIDYKALIVPDGCFTWGAYAWLPGLKTMAVPTETQKGNAMTLFFHLKNLIRVPLGKPLTISSGARTAEYTLYLRRKGIPAATKSAHNEWAAVDLHPPEGMSNAEFWHWCDERWPGRMENLAHTPTWVHLDTREWGKKVRFNP